jgi:3'-5' exonuclease
MTPVLIFDIETIPDIDGLRRLHNVGPEASDHEVAEMGMLMRRQQTGGSDFLPHYLQRVVTISCVLRTEKTFKVWSLAHPEAGEAEMLQRFFDGIEKYTPQIVSWNGGGFDLPVLHYRAMLHGVSAPRYWDWGDDDRDFKYNNYLNRYHTRHLDLMDVLAMFQGAPMRRWTRWPSCMAFPANWAWMAARCGMLSSAASMPPSAITARPMW